MEQELFFFLPEKNRQRDDASTAGSVGVCGLFRMSYLLGVLSWSEYGPQSEYAVHLNGVTENI